MKGYKLFRVRKDGSIGPLFINKRQRLETNVWYQAEAHRTKGYAFRPGWHICSTPSAPHLSKNGRVWAEVEFNNHQEIVRPANQGGLWYLAEQMKIVRILEG